MNHNSSAIQSAPAAQPGRSSPDPPAAAQFPNPHATMSQMSHSLPAKVWKEGHWYVSQSLEVNVASQGETEEEALANLKEALELYFEPPTATR